MPGACSTGRSATRFSSASKRRAWSYVSMRHYHVAPYFSLTEHSMAPAVLIFSKRVWDTLTKDEQAIIRSSAKDSVPLMRRLWDDYETSGRKTVEAAGGEIVSDVNKKAFADLLTPYYTPVTLDPALQALIARVRADEAE
jgi:TRAP-type C4-dicarboxylate transport system substrate-binding protein